MSKLVTGVVVPALPVFGLVIDGVFHHFYFTGGKVALEIGAVVHGVPEAELHIAEYIQGAGGVGPVGQGQTVDLAGVAPGHEKLLPGGDAVLLAIQQGIAQTVAAGVDIQLGLGGLPARVPDDSAVVDVDAVAVHVQGRIVVAVAGDPAQPGVPVKAVSAAGVGHQTEEILTAEVVDPRQRGTGRVDHIFPARIIKMSESHSLVPPLWKTGNAEIIGLRKRFRIYGPNRRRGLLP